MVEKPAIEIFASLGWSWSNCFDETFGERGSLGRDNCSEVVLISRLQPALRKLNLGLPEDALGLAVDALTQDRSTMSPAKANQEIYRLLKDGIKVSINDFFLASQIWISGSMYNRRADYGLDQSIYAQAASLGFG
jgi:type I restriction enzyme R subunit